jgi:hypothetical protein
MQLPPYGSVLAAHLKINPVLHVPVYIYTGSSAYSTAKRALAYGELAVAIPPDKTPYDYTWQLAHNKVVIVNLGGADVVMLYAFAQELCEAGALVVCVQSTEHNICEIFNRLYKEAP